MESSISSRACGPASMHRSTVCQGGEVQGLPTTRRRQFRVGLQSGSRLTAHHVARACTPTDTQHRRGIMSIAAAAMPPESPCWSRWLGTPLEPKVSRMPALEPLADRYRNQSWGRTCQMPGRNARATRKTRGLVRKDCEQARQAEPPHVVDDLPVEVLRLVGVKEEAQVPVPSWSSTLCFARSQPYTTLMPSGYTSTHAAAYSRRRSYSGPRHSTA